ncbi:hypothetical protein QCA50_014862 [Cerrena zonata]|uniref:Uncharacterized protein n=1 Tax=Cerrena zonata TaxID=2478898 RepID=A0AAW0FKF1_9APHY
MVAISHGFVKLSPGPSWMERLRSVLLIKDLGYLSKLFLRSGQIYYSATIGIHLAMAIIASSSAFLPDIIAQLTLLTTIIHGVMTCRMFRLLKLGAFDYLTDTTLDAPTQATEPYLTIVFRNVSECSTSPDPDSKDIEIKAT